MADTTIESIYASEIVIDEAYVDKTGSASRVDLTAALAVPAASAAAAQATANAAVPKSDPVLIGPVRVDLADTSDGTTYSFRLGFAGVLVSASMVLDGLETAVGSAGVTIKLTNADVTLSAPLEQPAGTAPLTALTVTMTGGPWIFAATDFITITTVATNTAKTFGGITLTATRT